MIITALTMRYQLFSLLALVALALLVDGGNTVASSSTGWITSPQRLNHPQQHQQFKRKEMMMPLSRRSTRSSSSSRRRSRQYLVPPPPEALEGLTQGASYTVPEVTTEQLWVSV